MSLSETQRRLWKLVTAPDGVAAALRESGSGKEGPLGDLIRGDERADASARLDVYASAYFYRIHGVLEKDYPALAATLGDDAFNDVATSYLLVHPPTHPSLRYAGAHLAAFLEDHPASAGIRERTPWAADLARFEWAMIDVFDALAVPVLEREHVAALPPEEFGDLVLQTTPDTRVVELDWPVAQQRTLRDKGEPCGAPAQRAAETMLVWRPEERVRYRSVSAAEALVLPALEAGLRFADVCEQLASAGDAEATPALAAGLLERWLADGILCGPAPGR